MKRIAAIIIAVALAVCLSPAPNAAEIDVPQLKELRKPIEKKEQIEEEKPIVPEKVSPEKRVDDPAAIFPGDAVCYFAVPDASRLTRDLADSPLGKFRDEPAYARMMLNNRFGIAHLFGDLPAAAITQSRVAAVAAAAELAADLAAAAHKIAAACYIDDAGRLSLAFAFDVGLDREAAFDVMGRWETGFFLANPGVLVERGDHAGNYLDAWTLPGSNEQSPAEIAVGFAENLAVVANNAALARQCLALLSSGGDSVAGSEWGRVLLASIPASATADAVGYIRMDALLKGLEGAPAAQKSVADWADYIGRGGREGEAMYYGLQFAPEGSRETFLMPSPGLTSSASLIELLAKRLKPAEKFTTPNVFPYQPNPALFLAGQMEGRQLGGLLRQERRLFGVSNDIDSFTMPAPARRLFSNELLAILTGEFGIAFYPSREDDAPVWLMVLPCAEDPGRLLPRPEYQVDRAGVAVMSRDVNVAGFPSWAVISPDLFRRAGGHHLLVASHGDLLFSAVDQLLANSTFAGNRDFVRALAQAESAPGLVFYFNLPEIMVRQYPDLSRLMRALYPRSSGLNSRPPLTMLRRYARGVLGAIAASPNGSRFSRVTVQAPAPMLAALASSVVLRYPAALRREGREAMEASRANLLEQWMRLQLYSSRFGHFPDGLDDLRASMRGDLTQEEIARIFTAPAALTRMSRSEAAQSSYSYLAGITANDEPDLPLIIEAAPWSDDFAGMHPDAPEQSPNETGDFQPYRQYIQLDGKVVVTPEKRFLETIQPRMMERE